MVRSSDEQITYHFGKIRACIHGSEEYKSWNDVERIGYLQQWHEKLLAFSDGIDAELEADGTEPHKLFSDKSWGLMAEELADEVAESIEVLSKDPDERTTAEVLYRT